MRRAQPTHSQIAAQIDGDAKLIEARLEPGTHDEIEVMKKQKLAIKDELYELLKRVYLERQAS